MLASVVVVAVVVAGPTDVVSFLADSSAAVVDPEDLANLFPSVGNTVAPPWCCTCPAPGFADTLGEITTSDAI